MLPSVTNTCGPQQIAPAPPAAKKLHPFQQKLHAIWQQFVTLLTPEKTSANLKIAPAKHIQTHIDNIATLEKAFKNLNVPTPTSAQNATDLQAESLEKKQAWLNAHHQAFSAVKQAIKAAKINPTHLPKEIALQVTEIVGRFGLAIYASTETPDPFKSSLDVLKTAFLLQQYALGLSDTCPNIMEIPHLTDLYVNNYSEDADRAIASLSPNAWGEKAAFLTQNQLCLVPQILRFINGAMRYLEIDDLPASERLLDTAKTCLLMGKNISDFDHTEINDQLAELIYNDMTGLVAKQIKRLSEQNNQELAKEKQIVLDNLWNECVTLSKDPEKMRARCNNKRTFIEKLNPKRTLELRILCLQGHLALPPECQDKILLALAWNNLSHAYESVGDDNQAFQSAKNALEIAIQCYANGHQNIQLEGIINNAAKWSARGLCPPAHPTKEA